MTEKEGRTPKAEVSPDRRDAVPTFAEEGGSAEVGARLEEARRELGLKQEELAAAMGISIGTYHRYRRGEGSPRVPELARLAKLAIDMNWLVTGVGAVMKKTPDASPASEELQTHARFLPDAGRFVMDEQLIVEAVVAIEAWLDDRDAILPPETKGKVVALLVEDAMAHQQEERAARIRSQAGLMLRLVA